MVFRPSRFRDHHTIAKTTKVSGVFHFLGEDISRVDDSSDMQNLSFFGLVAFTNLSFTQVDVLDGASLLHFAAQASTAEAVEIALEAGANAFARTHIMVRRVNFKIAFLSTYNDSRPSGRIL